MTTPSSDTAPVATGTKGTGVNALAQNGLRELIVGQLRHDGYMHLANVMTKELGMGQVAPSPRLNYLTRLGLKSKEEGMELDETALLNSADPLTVEPDREAPSQDKELDLDDPVASVESRPQPQWDSFFLAAHKMPCRCIEFSPSGRWLVSGSEDHSIKIMSTEIIRNKPHDHENVLRPVTQTLIGAHGGTVNDITFHPQDDIMVSGGEDATIRFYNLSRRRGQVRQHKQIVESAPVRALAFNPCGGHILVGTNQPVIRLYDVHSSQCYAAANAKDHHTQAINMIKYYAHSNTYVSCSQDGAVKIWDSVSNKCTATFAKAHHSSSVSSVWPSKNDHYLLTSGQDGLAKLWDLRFGRGELIQFEGVISGTNSPAVLVPGEEYVIGNHGKNQNSPLGVWDARTGSLLMTMKGHNKPIRGFATSPLIEGFMTAAGDSRIRHYRSPVGDSHSGWEMKVN